MCIDIVRFPVHERPLLLIVAFQGAEYRTVRVTLTKSLLEKFVIRLESLIKYTMEDKTVSLFFCCTTFPTAAVVCSVRPSLK